MRFLKAILLIISFPVSVNAAPVYGYPEGQPGSGHSFGNLNTYVSLNRTTDVIGDASTGNSGSGIHESIDQRASSCRAWPRVGVIRRIGRNWSDQGSGCARSDSIAEIKA